MRVFLGAFGDPGHVFPIIALGRELAGRGHAVTVETWSRWREHAESLGLGFVAAPEYPVFPTRERPLKPYQAVSQAVSETRPRLAAARPDVVVADVLTLAPALAAELEGVPAATLVPHVYPVGGSGLPPYSLGARPPRTNVGRALWRGLDGATNRGIRLGRAQYEALRARIGLPPSGREQGGLSPRLVLVGTYPELEYPRAWPGHVHVTGPLLWEPPFGEVEPPPGEAPLVLVAPSTSQDPRSSPVAGGARRARRARRPRPRRLEPPADRRARPGAGEHAARGVDLLLADDAALRGGRLPRRPRDGGAGARTPGRRWSAAPAGGDMGENAARLDWAGLGVRLPWRLTCAATLRLAVERALADRAMAGRVAEVAARSAATSGAARAADLVEGLAADG